MGVLDVIYVFIYNVYTHNANRRFVGGGGDGKEHCLLLPPF